MRDVVVYSTAVPRKRAATDLDAYVAAFDEPWPRWRRNARSVAVEMAAARAARSFFDAQVALIHTARKTVFETHAPLRLDEVLGIPDTVQVERRRGYRVVSFEVEAAV